MTVGQDRAAVEAALRSGELRCPVVRWTILLERLDAFTAEAAELAGTAPRIGSVGQTVSFVRRRLAAVAP